MVSLEEYEGHIVVVETTDRQIYRGFVGDYVESYHNENGEESIIIDIESSRLPVELFSSDIAAIDIVK